MRLQIIFLFLSIVFLSCNSKNEPISPQKKTLSLSVYASAVVQPDSLYEVYAAVSGILETQFVQEGDSVSKDQPLFQIFNRTPDLNKENAKLNLQKAKDDYTGRADILSGLEREVETALLRFRNDSINYVRQKRLWEQKIGSQVQFDERKLAFETAANQLQLLRNNYDRTKNELLNRVQQAENNYRSAMVNTQDFSIDCKINGRIYAIYKNEGELVTPQQPLASVGSSNVFVVELLVDEVDIVLIKTRQEVLLTLDAFANEVFKCRIIKIYPKKDERTQTFKVEAEFDRPPNVLYPGLAGEANILISQKENVLTIPLAYLQAGDQVVTDEGVKTVTTGIQNLQEVEILSGIDEQTLIYKPSE